MLRCLTYVLGIMCVLVSFSAAWGQKSADSPVKDNVIETKIGIDQVMEKNNPSITGTEQPANQNLSDLTIPGEQILKINQSLKKSIEENKQLLDEKTRLEEQIKMLRGQREVDFNRVNSLTQQRDELIKKISDAEELNKKSTEELEQLKKNLAQKEELLNTIKEGEGQTAMDKELQEQLPSELQVDQSLALKDESEFKTILSKLRKLNLENNRLRADAAKVHYNLGNIFFLRAEYEKAAAEYKVAVTLMPYDADAHYNLAFVCGEFLNDQRSALIHYQRYLYLNPDAEDADLVKEKILAAKLTLKSIVDSTIDVDKLQNSKALK